jgi:hypothetical protein
LSGTWFRIAFGRLSVFTAVALSFGGFFGLIARRFSADPWIWFGFGSFLPMGPLLLYFASNSSQRRNLAAWREWKEAGLITARQYDELRRNALEWYTRSRFGKPEGEESSRIEPTQPPPGPAPSQSGPA